MRLQEAILRALLQGIYEYREGDFALKGHMCPNLGKTRFFLLAF
jgi:hypothetical protein